MGNHIHALGFLETLPVLATLYPRRAAFDAVTLRQDFPGSPHRDTRSIFLRGPVLGDGMSAVARWFADVPHEDYGALHGWPEMAAMLEQIRLMAGGQGARLGKAMVVELKPGGALAWHVDEGPYAETHRRYHLPLTTNPLALLYAGGEQGHVPVGVLTFFNTRVLHSAVNLGVSPRMHLIVDLVRQE